MVRFITSVGRYGKRRHYIFKRKLVNAGRYFRTLSNGKFMRHLFFF